MASGMYFKVVAGALARRRSRTAIALLSVVVGASVAGAMVSISRDAERKVSQQLRRYGPDLVLTPRQGATLPEAIARVQLQGAGTPLPALYQIGTIMQAKASAAMPGMAMPSMNTAVPVVLVGTYPQLAAKAMPWWHVMGQLPGSSDGCLIGVEVARTLHLAPGDRCVARVAGRTLPLTVRGVLDAQGEEDGQIFLSLASLQQASGLTGRVSVVSESIPGELSAVTAIGERLASAYPEVEARPVLAIARSQGVLFAKLRHLMAIVTLVIVACAALCTGSTLLASASEREREFGLLKALGASRGRVARLFLGEALALGVCGGLVGWGVGLVFAQAIDQSMHAGWLAPDLAGFGAAMGVALLLAVGAGTLGLAHAIAVDPIVTLKGE